MLCPACGSENIDGSDRCENCLAPFRDLDVPRADSAEGLARSVMADNLSKLEHDQTVSVTSDTTAIEVVRMMKEAHSGCALVIDGNRLVGIFTEHDVLRRMGQSLAGVRDYVEPATLETDAPTQAIPIAGGEVAFSDVPLEEIRAEELESEPQNQATANERAAQQQPHHYGLEVSVRDLMSRNPETLNEQDSVAEALNKMSLGRYRHLPIQRHDGSYTVASIQSVLKYIAREDW